MGLACTKLIPLEHQEQAALIGWARYHPICNHYLRVIRQEAKRTYAQANFVQRQGIVAGVSDMLLAYPSNGKHGMWIELKRCQPARSNITDSQKIWLERMKNVGYEAVVAYGWEDARDKILNYLTEGEKNESIRLEKES